MSNLNNKTSLADKWLLLRSFIHTRWGLRFSNREKLQAWQAKSLQHYFKTTLPTVSYYAGLAIHTLQDLPAMDKSSMMSEFAARNSAAIERDAAMAIALQAEQSRDFSPTIKHPQLGELTVGMSSGTSGQRGLFLVSHQERLRWAGILLAKTLPSKLLRHILCLWRRPLSIAFFLRANSNLYNTLNSSRIEFSFYDLLQGVDNFVEQLNQQQPHALVAPATVLRRLAELRLNGKLTIQPLHILSVAEVLEPDDAALIEQAFAQKPQQIYQATEGFLGYSCEQGNLHLNESHILIEKHWLDAMRFQPVITDFSRTTQIIARYHLNDILRVANQPCPCGRAEMHIAEIEGRADQILWLPSLQSAQPSALFPDLLRRAMMLVDPPLQEYSILQIQSEWQIALPASAHEQQQQKSVAAAIAKLCQDLQLHQPQLSFCPWQAPAAGVKRRRIICAEGLQ
ncbi:MAG TPA: F390 synthetase-related protein [Cellvibrio sp.]|nr:F390 synthetase-related protein [Cellvibrio sp.]